MINDPKLFCYWLQGYFELGGENLSPQQVQIIKDHLALVFNKVTPSYSLSETIPQAQTYCGVFPKMSIKMSIPDTGVYIPFAVNTGEGPRFYGFSPNSQMYPSPSNQPMVTC